MSYSHFQIVYEPDTNQGVAVMGLNNPYATEFPATLCTDICDRIQWIAFDTKELTKGATYCCTIQDFVANVVPSLDTESFIRADLLIE